VSLPKILQLLILQGAAQCIEDSACLSLCLERAESITDLSKVLKAYETIRKPRTEWLAKKGRENAVMWHYPDGELQQKRDEFLSRGPLGISKAWDGKPIDDPPEGPFNPLTFPYMQGYDITDYVSFFSYFCVWVGLISC
jgi:salicylate hydroxylase